MGTFCAQMAIFFCSRCRSERSAGHLPLSEGALLRWVGFTEEMVPVAIGDLARSRRSHFFSVLPLCFLECCMMLYVCLCLNVVFKFQRTGGFIWIHHGQELRV